MLRWTITFFIGALVAAFFQFGGIAEGPAVVAKNFYFIFIAFCIATVIFEKKPVKHKLIHTFIKVCN
jgi:uncharacterized membrane protein YtjA (UPF0391 family)